MKGAICQTQFHLSLIPVWIIPISFILNVIDCIPLTGFAGLSLYSVSLTTATRANEHISLTRALHLCIAVEHSSTTWNSFLTQGI